MKKKTAIRTYHAPHFYILFAAVMIVVGAIAAIVATKVVQGSGVSAYNQLPYTCNGCNLIPYAAVFKGKDFSYAQISNSDFSGTDLSGVIFKNGYFNYDGFNNTNLTGADFSNMKDPTSGNILGFIINLEFDNANLTNANFSNSQFHNSDFTQANLQGTNFSNTQLFRINFSGAQNMSTANVIGVAWNNVTCPDGTNSDNHNNTCVDHF